MKDKIDEIIKELFKEAENGVVYAEDMLEPTSPWRFFIKFYTKIDGKSSAPENNNYPVLEIPSYKVFLQDVKDYLKVAIPFYILERAYFGLTDRSYTKKLISDLFISATCCDLSNIYTYIKIRKAQLEHKENEGEIYLGKYEGYKISSKIVKNVSNLEGPYRFCPKFSDNEGNGFCLPRITYGITDSDVYIYAIQNKKGKQTNKVAKALDRHFRKVNKGVDTESILSNVSPNALVSLTLFLGYLKSIGKTNIVAPIYMPIRYNARTLSDDNIKTTTSREELQEIQYRDQYNITNKLAYLLHRYNFHFPSSSVLYDDNTQTVYLSLAKVDDKQDDNIIYNLNNVVINTLNPTVEQCK